MEVEELRALHRHDLDRVRDSRPYRIGSTVLRFPRALRRWSSAGDAVAAQREQPGAARMGLHVAAILDEFSARSLAGTVPLTNLHPLTWKRQLERSTPDLLLVESAWHGRAGAWRHDISHAAVRRPELLEQVVSWCRHRQIPTVFWNKEDPVSFETFLPAARLFDVVATTAEECIESYRMALGHDRITVMPFAASIDLHHPVGSRNGTRQRVAFAGSWLEDPRFPERSKAQEALLGGAQSRGILDIYARDDTTFPPALHDAIIGSLGYADMVAAYRTYSAMLNVNSIVNSTTMLARRVFEIMGSGVPVISAPSPAIDRWFADLVLIADDEAAVGIAIDECLDRTRRDRIGGASWRRIHAAHTYDHRLAELCAFVGIDPGAPDERVGVITIDGEAGRSSRPPEPSQPAETVSCAGWGDVRRAATQLSTPLILLADCRETFTADDVEDLVLARRFSPTGLVARAGPSSAGQELTMVDRASLGDALLLGDRAAVVDGRLDRADLSGSSQILAIDRLAAVS